MIEAMPPRARRLLWWRVLAAASRCSRRRSCPAAMKLSGDVARVWFLALYLPEPWQWPTIAFMALLGIGALVFAWRMRR